KMLGRSFVGSPETVRHGLESFIEETSADELIVASAIYDHAARLRSYEILADVHKALGRERSGTGGRVRKDSRQRRLIAEPQSSRSSITAGRFQRVFPGTTKPDFRNCITSA